MSRIDLGLIDPQLAGNYFSFPVRLEGNRDLKEQSLNAYEVGYTAIVAKGRASLGAAFYINDSKGDFYWPQTGSYTSQNPPPGWPLPPFVLDALIAANAFGPGMGLPSLITTQNLGKVRNKGLELNADARLNRYVTGFANYSWQARPESKDFDISLINLPPTHRFNAGLGFDYKRYLGNVSVGYVGSAYWNDVLGAALQRSHQGLHRGQRQRRRTLGRRREVHGHAEGFQPGQHADSEPHLRRHPEAPDLRRIQGALLNAKEYTSTFPEFVASRTIHQMPDVRIRSKNTVPGHNTHDVELSCGDNDAIKRIVVDVRQGMEAIATPLSTGIS